MDNDTLINQARNLYAKLETEQHLRAFVNKPRFARLNRLVIIAQCRYQRRLNRCVLCYDTRISDCWQNCFTEQQARELTDLSHPHNS